MTSPELMDLRARFRARLFRWAVNDAAREVQAGLPYLRTIKYSPLHNIFGWMNSLSADQQLQLLIGLIRRTERQLTGVTEEVSREDELMRQYRELYSHTSDEHRLVLEQKLAGTWKGISRKRLRQAVREHGRAILGCDPESGSSLGVRYENKFGNWIVYTYITLGANAYDLSYNHFLVSPSGGHVDRTVSILSWLGIAGQTCWDDLTEADLDPVAKAVVQISSHFLAVAGTMLKDL